MPIGMKDLFCTRGVQAASHILEGFTPRIRKRRSFPEAVGRGHGGCWASSTWTSSRWARRTRPASSATSSRRGVAGTAAMRRSRRAARRGAAPAVAARYAPGATGTDAGGSIRQPAFVGISGIKPTYGRCSRWGVIAFASSLDQAGPMARDVRDCAIMLEAMSGFDAKDATSLDLPVPQWEQGLNASLAGKRVGVPRNTASTACPPRSRRCGSRASPGKDAGAEVVEVSLPHRMLRAARLLHHRAGGGVLQPRALRRGPLWPARAARGRQTSRKCTRRRAPTASATR
ncbi:amidase family protein [Sphingomonas sp. MMS24-JH45]